LQKEFEMKVPVRSPEFDDERTLQSARPVVPLNQIDAKVRRRRNWFLGGAFAMAMILGAASALVASYLRLRDVPSVATSEVSEPDVAPAPLAVVENTPSPEPAESPVTEEPDEALLEEETPKKEPVAKRRTVVKHTQQPVDLRDDPKISEEDRLQQIRDAVLYDEWQERRARRVMRRERRLDRYNHRDLSNLDEIFEGRRRRQRP
jgi:type IV secretory pathway VirB10-like protein